MLIISQLQLWNQIYSASVPLKIIKDTLLGSLYIKMPRKYRDQYTGTNIEIHTEIFHVLRPDLKICWFAVTQPGLQETSRSILKFFLVTNILSQLCLPWTWTLESKVNFLFFLLHHFLVVCVVLTILTHFPMRRLHQTALYQAIQINQWKASAAAIINKNDK